MNPNHCIRSAKKITTITKILTTEHLREPTSLLWSALAPCILFIITNPTHYAVAIRYSEKDAKAPYIVAKGIDEMALRIKAVGQRHQIEVLEVPVLARAIYYSTRVDQEVPKGLYTAVAYVLTYVMQLKAYKQGRGHKPAPIPDIFIPSSLQKQANERGSTL